MQYYLGKMIISVGFFQILTCLQTPENLSASLLRFKADIPNHCRILPDHRCPSDFQNTQIHEQIDIPLKWFLCKCVKSSVPCSTMCCAMLCLVAQLCLTLCNTIDYSQPGSSIHGDSPGKSSGVGCHALLQGSNPGFLHCRQILYHLSHQGSQYQNSKNVTDIP